jgi:hypothetical protein
MKSETTRGGLVFINSNLSAAIHKREPLLIVLELISIDSGLKLFLMKVLSKRFKTRTIANKLITYQQ